MATKYEAVGSGIEDMTTSQNYDTKTVKDVLGVSSTKATKGNKAITVSPVTINPNSEWAKFIDTAIERQYELSQLEKEFLFVKSYKLISGNPVAWKQKAVVVPTDWAIGNADLQAGVEVNLIGEATYGTLTGTGSNLSFTPETTPPASSEITYVAGDAKRSDFIMYFITETA